jgi:hypothetical protein
LIIGAVYFSWISYEKQVDQVYRLLGKWQGLGFSWIGCESAMSIPVSTEQKLSSTLPIILRLRLNQLFQFSATFASLLPINGIETMLIIPELFPLRMHPNATQNSPYKSTPAL